MSDRTRNNLNPHRIPNVAKYRALANHHATWARMVNSTDFNAPGGCWEWQIAINENGYGIFSHHEYGNVLAHRLSLHVVGRPVPVDMTVDHLCRNRACVNPAHLEIVTQRVNALRGEGCFAQNARKTHCKHGHEFSDENTGHTKATAKRPTARFCKTCRTAYSKAKYAKSILNK